MAIDQTPSPTTSETKPSAAIENEFPTYRAISSLAVFSLVLGLASVFCFANLWFLLLVAGSILTGFLALRNIKRLPEILTGASFARVGIGIGMLFGLTSITHEVVQEIQTTMDASRFAKHYVEIIKDKPVSLSLWYEQNVEYRQQKSPDEVAEEMKKAKNPANPDPYGSKAAPIQRVKDRLKSSGQEVHYSKIESKLVVGLTTYANALIEVDGPATKEFPTKEYGIIQMTKAPGAGPYEWVVQDFKYPYTPSSETVKVPHGDDDGHGHG